MLSRFYYLILKPLPIIYPDLQDFESFLPTFLTYIYPYIHHTYIQCIYSVTHLCDPLDCSMPGFPVHHQFLELAQTHVHWVSDTFQPSYALLSPSPPSFNLSQHQSLFKWVSSSHQVAKVLEFQLQHQSFQWIFRTDFLWDWLVGSPCSPRDSQESTVHLVMVCAEALVVVSQLVLVNLLFVFVIWLLVEKEETTNGY